MGRVLVGTAGWADRTLLRSGRFYPKGSTAESRLRYYASRLSLVEVDATYYALPEVETARAWAERTPPGFVFDVKAYALLTGHPANPAALPKDLKASLPAALTSKRNLYMSDLPTELEDEIWSRFRLGLAPLEEAGKMGAVLLQFPPWFTATPKNAAILRRTAERMGDTRVSIELRHGSWLAPETQERTLSYLERLSLPIVDLDMPQGFPNSMPSLTAVTAKHLAVVRFHGRNRETWAIKTETAAERFRHLYTAEELDPWRARIREIAEKAEEVHVVFNNCFEDYAVKNALDFQDLLRDPQV